MTREYNQRFLQARKQIIERYFAELNEMQRQAVMTTQGPLLLLAGAGSGKTTVLINRIANLIQFGRGSDSNDIPPDIQEKDVLLMEEYCYSGTESIAFEARQRSSFEPAAPWSIIAITFTNKAANELKNRLSSMLGEAANGVWAMTFHSACCRILRQYIDLLGYNTNFTIYDMSDAERVMRDILKEMQLDEKSFPPKLFLSVISKAKDQMQSPDEFEHHAAVSGDYRMERIASAYREYQKRLKEANAVDFDDILLLTVELLQGFEEVRSYYQRKFKYVMIDEYQDTNHLQYLFASLIADGSGNICVVGDDDQSIYRFRGATIENILDFEKQYAGARVIRLEQNYRSTQSILQVANSVISHNKGRKGKTLWTDNENGERILVHESINEGDEARFAASKILQKSQGKDFRDFAILYRTNAQSNALEYAMKQNGIPYRMIGGTRFFDRAEVKDMLAYLCIINNRSDDLRLRRIINNPPRGIGAKTVEAVARHAELEEISMYSVVADAASYGPLEKSAKKLRAFSDLIESCTDLLDSLSLPDFYEELLIRTGYSAMLQEKNDPENETRLENVRELKSSIVSYIENTTEPSLNGFLEEIALYTDIEQYDSDADAIVMMTMHSAKGLEFSHVFLVGFEEGLFPSSRGVGSEEEMEEERRLCYVGITRAKKSLTVTYAKQRMLYGHTTFGRPSRFLQEMPKKYVQSYLDEAQIRDNTCSESFGIYRNGTSRNEKRGRFKSSTTEISGYKSVPMIDLQKGDMVKHNSFGKGMVLSVLPVGNDALVEIAFEDIGTKKLMAKTASAHMQKL